MNDVDRRDLDSGVHEVEVNANIEIAPCDTYTFNELLLIEDTRDSEFIPREDELEFSFPFSTGASRLIYKELNSF